MALVAAGAVDDVVGSGEGLGVVVHIHPHHGAHFRRGQIHHLQGQAGVDIVTDHGGRGAQVNGRIVGDEVGVGTVGDDRRAAGIDGHSIQFVGLGLVVQEGQGLRFLVHFVKRC